MTLLSFAPIFLTFSTVPEVYSITPESKISAPGEPITVIITGTNFGTGTPKPVVTFENEFSYLMYKIEVLSATHDTIIAQVPSDGNGLDLIVVVTVEGQRSIETDITFDFFSSK